MLILPYCSVSDAIHLHCTCTELYNGSLLNFVTFYRMFFVHSSRKPPILTNQIIREKLRRLFRIKFIVNNYRELDFDYTVSELECLERLQSNVQSNASHAQMVTPWEHRTNQGQLKFLHDYLNEVFQWRVWRQFRSMFCKNAIPKCGDLAHHSDRWGFHHSKRMNGLQVNNIHKISSCIMMKCIFMSENIDVEYMCRHVV